MLYPSLTTTDFTVITGFTFYIDVVYLLSAAFIEGYIGQVYTDKSIINNILPGTLASIYEGHKGQVLYTDI